MTHEDCETYWREKIASEIKEAISHASNINAYGIYLLVKKEM